MKWQAINVDLCHMLGLDPKQVRGFNLRVRAGAVPSVVVSYYLPNYQRATKRYELVEVTEHEEIEVTNIDSTGTEWRVGSREDSV